MDINHLSQPAQLERNCFFWSEVRLVLAAVALFLGGVPPVVKLFGYDSGVWGLLKLAWLVSGVASAYLGYRWMKNNWTVFGGKNQKDVVAFGVSVVTGINLGLAGLLGDNIGMSIISNHPVFVVVGVLYLWAAYHLYTRWNAHSQRLFS